MARGADTGHSREEQVSKNDQSARPCSRTQIFLGMALIRGRALI